MQSMYSPRKTNIYRESQRCLCLQWRLHLGSRMRVLHSRGTAHPICELGVWSSLLNSSILLLFRQPLTSSMIVFSPTCLHKLNCNRFYAHERLFFSASAPNNPPFLPVGALWLPVIAQWLEHSTCSRNMSHKNIITIHFHIWTWYTPTIIMSRACHGFQ